MLPCSSRHLPWWKPAVNWLKRWCRFYFYNSWAKTFIKICSSPDSVQSKSSPSLLRTHTCTPQSLGNLIVTKTIKIITDFSWKKAKFHRLYCNDYLELGFHWTGDEQMPRPPCVFAVRSCPMKQLFQLNWEDTSLPITLTFKLKRWFIFKDCCKLIQGKGNYFRKQWLCQKELS